MTAFLLGLQGGYTKHFCFLCLWNNRADEQHYLPITGRLTNISHQAPTIL